MKKLFTTFTALIILSNVIAQNAPNTLNIQGVLTDNLGQPVAEGTYSFIFSIYDAAIGGTQVGGWSETHSTVDVDGDGLYNVVIGNITPINLSFDEPYWLEINVEGETFSDRLELTGPAYVLNADLQDLASDGFLTGSKVGSGIPGDNISDGTIDASEIEDNTITADDIATSAIGTDEILDNTIAAIDIGPSAVGTTEIADNSVTVAKLSGLRAIAAGYIADDGTIVGGTGNFSVQKMSVGGYRITVSGVDFEPTQHLIQITGFNGVVGTWSGGGGTWVGVTLQDLNSSPSPNALIDYWFFFTFYEFQ